MPQIVIVPHENMGVAMAHGYAMVAGTPQAVMVHVSVGTANSLNGLINASSHERADPSSRAALRSPNRARASRNTSIHWAQEHFDQGGMVREFVKWDYELRHAEQVESARPRARHREDRAAGPPVPHTAAGSARFGSEQSEFSLQPTIVPPRPAPTGCGSPRRSRQAPRRRGAASAAHHRERRANAGLRPRIEQLADAGGAGGALPPAPSCALHRAPDALRPGTRMGC